MFTKMAMYIVDERLNFGEAVGTASSESITHATSTVGSSTGDRSPLPIIKSFDSKHRFWGFGLL